MKKILRIGEGVKVRRVQIEMERRKVVREQGKEAA
jgi:hypothetical protein